MEEARKAAIDNRQEKRATKRKQDTDKVGFAAAGTCCCDSAWQAPSKGCSASAGRPDGVLGECFFAVNDAVTAAQEEREAERLKRIKERIQEEEEQRKVQEKGQGAAADVELI